jgi:hypothetical protein
MDSPNGGFLISAPGSTRIVKVRTGSSDNRTEPGLTSTDSDTGPRAFSERTAVLSDDATVGAGSLLQPAANATSIKQIEVRADIVQLPASPFPHRKELPQARCVRFACAHRQLIHSRTSQTAGK